MAHVWDVGAKKWWRCDDETVTEMPKGPVAERGDHGVAAEKKVRCHLYRHCTNQRLRLVDVNGKYGLHCILCSPLSYAFHSSNRSLLAAPVNMWKANMECAM